MKYYVSFGPACSDYETLLKMIELGMSGIRLNLSHGSLSERLGWIENLRRAERASGKKVEIILDINGPESRIKLREPFYLKKDDTIICGRKSLDNYPLQVDDRVFDEIKAGDILNIDDGKFTFLVIRKVDNLIDLKSNNHGFLIDRKSISIRGRDLELPILTNMDIDNLREAKKLNIKSIMQPFVKTPEDVEKLRQAMGEIGIKNGKIYAKIEDKNGLNNFEEISKVCDVLVIARGDLGNNLGLVVLPKIQKRISKKLVEMARDFMVVTEFLNSMVENDTPTRSELNDIYNSVLDGAGHLMLTKETAIGKYPLKALEYLIKVSETGNGRIL